MKLNFRNLFLYFFVLASINSCKKDEVVKLLPVAISPSTSTIDEGFKRKTIKIKFSSPVDQADSVQVLIATNATYGQDFTTTPAAKSNIISLYAAKGDTVSTFQMSANLDNSSDPDEIVSFSLKKLPSGFEPDQTALAAAITILDNSLYNGLIGEYLFDGSAVDTSPSKNNGTVHEAIGTADHLNSGNNAYNFDGINDYISIPSTTDLNFLNSDFSISVWAAAASPQESASNGIFDIVRKWSGDAQGYPFAIVFLNDQPTGTHNGAFSAGRYDGSACAHSTTTTSGIINSTSYHHIVQIKSGSVLQLFIDGVKVSEQPDVTTCGETNTSQVTVGCRGQLARFFKGSIDDLRFYKRALTQTEINVLFRI